MRKKYLKKILSLVLAGSMVLTSYPVSAAPAGTDLREQMRQAVSDEDYPNGLVGFGQTQLSVNEGEKTTITVFRQGNTDTEATVRFKAIDVSAEYGKDYLLTVEHSGLRKEQLDVNENAVPLMEQSAMSGDINNSEVLIEEEPAASEEEAVVNEAASAETLKASGKATGLQAAYKAQVKEEAPSNDWTETNPETVPEDVQDAMAEGNDQAITYFEQAEGQETVLTFKKGEYEKDIVVETIDDDKSESEEQFVFVLCDAEGTQIDANYNGYVNIKDDEEAEDNVFAVKEKAVSVGEDEDTAKVTIVRTSGVDQLAFVTVGTRSIDAVPNTDYEAVTQELIFAAGVTEKTIEIPIIGDRAEQKQFYVGISSEGVVCEEDNAAAVVTIEKRAVVPETEETGIHAAASGDESVKVTNTGNFSGAWISDALDLRLATKITVNFNVWGQRSWTRDVKDGCKTKSKTDIFRDKQVKFVVAKDKTSDGRDILTTYGTYGNYEHKGCTLTFERDIDSKFEAWKDLGNAYIWIQTYGINSNDSAQMHVNSITVHYQDYTISINNSTTFNTYQEQQYTGSKSAGSILGAKPITLGKACFDGSVSNNTAAGHRGTLGLGYQISTDEVNSVGVPVSQNTVVFKGYRFKQRNSQNDWSEEPDMLSGGITYEMVKKYKDKYMLNNHTFNITPCFEVKEATVEFNNDNAKVDGKANAKGQFNGFNEAITMKKLDSLDLAASSNEGYAVTAIEVASYITTTSVVSRRPCKKTTNRTRGNYTASNAKSANADKNAFKTGLGDTADTFYTVSLSYENAALKVMPDPSKKNTDNIKKGFVLYVDDNKNVYKASLNKNLAGNDAKDSFSIENVSMQKTYELIGVAEEGYMPVWRDGTLDGDEDGKDIPAKTASYESFTPVQGSVLPYTTKLSIGRVYYDYTPLPDTGDPGTVYGHLKLGDRYILNQNSYFERGLNGANISVNGKQVQTATGGTNEYNQAPGYFEVEDPSFEVHGYYLVNANYYGEEGSINTSFVMNPGMTKTCVIDTKDDLTITNAKVYLKDDKGKYQEQKLTFNKKGVYTGISNGDNDIRIEMRATKSGLYMKGAKLQFYDTDGLKIDKEVAGTAFGDENSGYFRFDFNPDKLGIPGGATLRVVFTDNQDHDYLQRQLGMMLPKSLGIMNLANSFTFGGANTAVKMIGKIESAFNLGWNGNFDKDADHVSTDDEGNKLISVGFNKEIINKTENRSNIKKAADALAAKDKAIADVNKEYSKYVQQANKSGKVDEKKKSELQEKVKKAYDDKKSAQSKYDEVAKNAQNPNKTQTTIGGNASLSVGFSFVMVLGLDDSNGQYYFKSMTLTASVSGGVKVTVAFATPIGITINLGFGAGGEGAATFIVEERKDMIEAEKYYVTDLADSNGSIDIFDCNLSNANRKFDGYGSFSLKPYIEISVGAGVLGNAVSVTVSGKAQFDMQFFTSAQENNGTVNLSADLTVKVLFISHTWKLASTDVNLFGNSGSASLTPEGTTYLYDPSDVLKAEDISYMKGGSKWKSGKISAKSLDESEAGYAESTIADKIAENPDFRMVKLEEGRYAAVFTNVDPKREDDAINAKAVYFTTYEDGKWAEPVLVEDDGTLDEEPNIFDAGEKYAVVTWSSADRKFTDETSRVDMQNSLNLHCAFVDRKTGKLLDIQEVTKTTKDAGDYNDETADVSANVSYNDDSMIIYYQKKEYTPQEDGKEYLGDVLFPTTTVMASRIYSFKDGKWNDTYRAEDYEGVFESDENSTAEEKFAMYSKGFYGQEFFDFLPQVVLEEKLDEDGFWTEQPTVTALKAEDTNKALIVDTDAMSYNDLGVFAYTIDRDGDRSTVADRDVYMQIYDFKESAFLHPIVVNSDGVEDKNVRFFRVGDITFLSWLHDGNIQALNMSNIVGNYKTLLVKGEEGNYYYINKTKPETEDAGQTSYLTPVVAVEGEKAETDNAVSAIGDFDVQASDDNVYFIWTQTGVSLKDGVKEGSYEAMDPANSVAESQLYTARYDVAAGTITKPVQITSGVGANYSSVAFVVEKDNMVGLAYKAESRTVTLEEYNASIEENNKEAAKGEGSNGKGIEDNEMMEPLNEDNFVPFSKPDIENAAPYAFRVDPKSTVKIKNIGFTGRVTAGTDNRLTFEVLNDGLDTVSDLTLTAVGADGKSVLTDNVIVEPEEKDEEAEALVFEEQFVDSIRLEGLIGGDSRNAFCQINVPEDADKAEVTIEVKDQDGKVVASEKVSETMKAQLCIEDFAVAQTDNRNQFRLTGILTNIGGKTAEAGKAQLGYVKDGEQVSAELDYAALKPDETVEFEEIVTVDCADAFTAETDKGGNVTETAVFYGRAGEGYAEDSIQRTADETKMRIVKAVKDVTLSGADAQGLKIELGADTLLTPEFTSELADAKKQITGAENLQYFFVSEDEEIVSVANRDLATGLKKGETTVKMFAYPKDSTFVAENRSQAASVEENGLMGTYEDAYLSIPQSAVIVKEFKVQVVDKLETQATTEAPGTQATTEKPAAQATTEKPAAQGTTQKPAAQATTEKATAPATTEAPAKVGEKVTIENAEYLVSADGEVAFTAAAGAAQMAVTVPATVKAADGTEYKVTSVAANAFKNNKKLKKVTLGKNVTTVEKNAFSGCSALTSVKLDAALTTIGAGAFQNCKKLNKVTIPKNVTTIEKNAFSGCTSLKTITIKSVKLKKIGKKAFNKINKKAVFKLSGSKKQKAAVKKLFKSSTGYKSTMKIK